MLDFCFLFTCLAHSGSNEMLISPIGTDPDSPNPQTVCFKYTTRPTAHSRNILISLRYATGILLRDNRLFLVATHVFVFRGTKTFLSRLSVLDLTSLASKLATDLPLTHVRRAVLHH